MRWRAITTGFNGIYDSPLNSFVLVRHFVEKWTYKFKPYDQGGEC